MTFDQIVSTVASRVNLTSATALARIGVSVNERYRWLTTSVGITTIARRVPTATAIVGNRYLAFGPQPGILGVQKVLSVFNADDYDPPMVLGQITFDQMRNQTPGTDPCQQYAIAEMGAKSVTLFLGSSPSTAYVLSADALCSVDTLQGAEEPAFSETFHNLLIYGALATEYEKMEKDPLATKNEKKWDDRVAELRLFIAMSAYLNIYQNRTGSLLSVPLVSP